MNWRESGVYSYSPFSLDNLRDDVPKLTFSVASVPAFRLAAVS